MQSWLRRVNSLDTPDRVTYQWTLPCKFSHNSLTHSFIVTCPDIIETLQQILYIPQIWGKYVIYYIYIYIYIYSEMIECVSQDCLFSSTGHFHLQKITIVTIIGAFIHNRRNHLQQIYINAKKWKEKCQACVFEPKNENRCFKAPNDALLCFYIVSLALHFSAVCDTRTCSFKQNVLNFWPVSCFPVFYSLIMFINWK